MVANPFRIAVLLLLGLLTSAALGAQESPAVSAMHGLGDVRHHRLDSEVLGRSFEILVALPAGYAADDASRYPAVYLLDGGATFPMLGGYSRYLRLAQEIPDLIVVGIALLPSTGSLSVLRAFRVLRDSDMIGVFTSEIAAQMWPRTLSSNTTRVPHKRVGVLCRKCAYWLKASRPRNTWRLPIMCPITNPNSTMPLTAITYFLPSAVE